MKKLIVPVVTPFREDETVDYAELKRIVRGLFDEGADGIFAGGSSAECFLLTDEERKKVLEATVEAADGGFVIAHVGAVGVRRTEEFARHAKRVGADAVASVPPFYFGFRYENIRAYYWALADAAELPTMIYYFPANTGTSFDADQMAEILLGRENIRAVKFTDSDYYVMQRIKALTGREIISGKDECFLSALAAGADGAIGTTFNFMLGHYKKILALTEEGKWEEALKIQAEINDVIAAMRGADIFHATKYLMGRRGYHTGIARRPFLPLTEEQKHRLSEACERNHI